MADPQTQQTQNEQERERRRVALARLEQAKRRAYKRSLRRLDVDSKRARQERNR